LRFNNNFYRDHTEDSTDHEDDFDTNAERNALFPILKLVKELDFDNKKKLE
jgi:hypothetical protein